MKNFLKSILFRFAPQQTAARLSARARAHSHRVIASWGSAALTQKLVDEFGSVVLDGPFAGVVLSPMTHAEQLGPYILGVYESELDDAWKRVLQGSFTQIVDIGARFGYYAVGLARRYPVAAVIAFDPDWWARDAIREMIAANRTANVTIESFCSAAWLGRNIKDGALIMSDCEGYESVLFDGATIPRLRMATLIIETHDAFAPGIRRRLTAAFAATHEVREFNDGLTAPQIVAIARLSHGP